MPCRDDRPVNNEQPLNLEPRLAPASLLCEAMTIIESIQDLAQGCSTELLDWWDDHKRREAARVRAEAAAKLTDRELLVLGIRRDGTPR